MESKAQVRKVASGELDAVQVEFDTEIAEWPILVCGKCVDRLWRKQDERARFYVVDGIVAAHEKRTFLQIGSMVMQSANNGLGSVYVSAFTAAMKIKQFMMCPFDAISTAASVFCSQNLGAGQAKRIHQGLRQGVLVGVGYGAFAGVIMLLFGLPLTKLFIVSSAFEAINASAKYLRCLGFFYWMLGILNVCRMVTQGLGYSGRAVFSGVMEMLARTIICLGFVGAFGFTAICFADQAAWLAACCYIAPTCLYCVKKSTKMIADRGAK